MKKISKLQIFAWVLALVPTVLVAIFYRRLPAQIPTHWDMNGTVTYGAKSTLWMFAGMALLFGVLFPVLRRIDPRARNYDKFSNSYDLFQVVMMLFLIVMTGIVILESMRPGTVQVSAVVCMLCSILMLVLGNMMPKFRQNYFCGMKNPWTLASEIVWVRTHRVAGRMLFVTGLIGLAGSFVPSENARMALLMVPLMVAVIVPNVLSFIWYRREKAQH